MEKPSLGYVSLPCALGHALVAGTQRGVCFVRFGTTRRASRPISCEPSRLRQFQRPPPKHVSLWGRAIADYVDGRSDAAEVPLDVRGSKFEQRVWRALRSIPMGEPC